MRLALMMICLLVAGCATKYQDMGFAGGVAAQQMTSNTFRIVSRGNGYTGQTQVADYTMLKAAETTKQNGATHFLIVSASDASSQGQIVTGGTAQTSFVGNTAYTNYTPAQVHSFVRPGQDTYIRILSVKPGEAPPQGAISADEIIQFVGSRVQRG